MSGRNSGSFSIAASVTSKVSSAGRNATRIRFSFERLGQYRLPREDGIKRGETLLAVDDEELGHLLVVAAANLSGADVDTGLPEHERSDGVTPVQRVEEIACLGRRPHEWPLDVRQSDVAMLDVLDQMSEGSRCLYTRLVSLSLLILRF